MRHLSVKAVLKSIGKVVL